MEAGHSLQYSALHNSRQVLYHILNILTKCYTVHRQVFQERH